MRHETLLHDAPAPVVEEPVEVLDDGTLIFAVPKGYLEYINRVIIEDGKVFCKTFYMDEDKN